MDQEHVFQAMLIQIQSQAMKYGWVSRREKRKGYGKGRENKVMVRDRGNGYAS